MKVLVISDIHANLTALEAVLADAAGEYEVVWFLGDLVGYGPDPNECIERLRAMPGLVRLLGNHDIAVLDGLDVSDFNLEARQAILWTKQVLTLENLQYLAAGAEQRIIGAFTLVHGSPRYPIWEYLLDIYAAATSFAFFDTDYCLVGHTHMPAIFQQRGQYPFLSLEIPPPNVKIDLLARAILNPGSVGQPRDHNPDAAYAILDTEEATWESRRVPYDIAAVQARMQAVGLPERHTARLAAGW